MKLSLMFAVAAAVAAALMSTGAVAQDFDEVDPESPYVTDSTKFSCPAKAKIGDVITIKKPVGGGFAEFGMTDPSGMFSFLVLRDVEPGTKPLMTSTALLASKSVSIATATLSGFAGGTNTKVFRKPGEYAFYLSGNLESEEGGYMCTTKIVAAK